MKKAKYILACVCLIIAVFSLTACKKVLKITKDLNSTTIADNTTNTISGDFAFNIDLKDNDKVYLVVQFFSKDSWVELFANHKKNEEQHNKLLKVEYTINGNPLSGTDGTQDTIDFAYGKTIGTMLDSFNNKGDNVVKFTISGLEKDQEPEDFQIRFLVHVTTEKGADKAEINTSATKIKWNS